MNAGKDKNMPSNKKPRRLSKRGILILANGIALAVLLIVQYVEWVFGKLPYETVFKYLMAMCVFAIMSLIVYYLSIIADAVSSKKTGADTQKKD